MPTKFAFFPTRFPSSGIIGTFSTVFWIVFSEISKAYPIKPDEFESDAQLKRLSWTDLFVIGQAFQEQNAYDFCSLWLGEFNTNS